MTPEQQWWRDDPKRNCRNRRRRRMRSVDDDAGNCMRWVCWLLAAIVTVLVVALAVDTHYHVASPLDEKVKRDAMARIRASDRRRWEANKMRELQEREHQQEQGQGPFHGPPTKK